MADFTSTQELSSYLHGTLTLAQRNPANDADANTLVITPYTGSFVTIQHPYYERRTRQWGGTPRTSRRGQFARGRMDLTQHLTSEDGKDLIEFLLPALGTSHLGLYQVFHLDMITLKYTGATTGRREQYQGLGLELADRPTIDPGEEFDTVRCSFEILALPTITDDYSTV